jgi:AcrR family transcriptional regulator
MPTAAPRRLTRDEQRARTRERLIAAARRTFARQGFHRAGLEEIAAEAGYSTGAIYANFKGKEDLFLAVLDEHVADRTRATEAAVAGGTTPAERARAGADNWMQFLREDPDWYPLFIEFWSYALRDPEVKRQAAARFAVFPQLSARLFAENVQALGIELAPELAPAIGTLLTAAADGLALMKVIDPDSVPDELFGDALEALANLGLEASERV